MKTGCARISTDEQSLDLQRDALRRADCAEVFEDGGVSGIAKQRVGLEAALAKLQEGDVLVVWKLDRLGRSLSEKIDTTTAGCKLIFHIMGALAEFERSLIVERVNAGIAAAKKRGKHVGRPGKLTPEQVAHTRDAIEDGKQTCGSMAGILGVDHSTLWRAMRIANDAKPVLTRRNFQKAHEMHGGGQHGH